MERNEEKLTINKYIGKISKLLPYPKEKKKEALEVLQSDVMDAMKDNLEGNPIVVFGKPMDVAKDIVEGNEWHTNRAGWQVRTIAWAIDLIIKLSIGFLILIIGFMVMLTIMPFDELVDEFAKWGNGSFKDLIAEPEGQLITLISFITISLGALAFFTYNIVLEHYFSATIGKKWFKLVVVDHNGIKMQGRQTIIRNLSKIVLGEFLILDVLLGMIMEKQTPERTQKQRGLDILAETIVIQV